MTPRRQQQLLCGLLLIGCATPSSAFTTSSHMRTSTNVKSFSLASFEASKTRTDNDDNIISVASTFTATLAIAVALTIQPQPALAVQPTLNEAIVEVADTSYPILRALEPTAFQAFSTKIGDYLLRINPDKLGKSLELGIDALDTVNPEELAKFNSLLKDIYADVSIDSCTTVPLPPMAVADKFFAIAKDKIASEKLTTFQETWKPTLDALKKTDSSICLPQNRAGLDNLALGQADLARTFGTEETKAFGKYTTPLVKQVITPGNALSLVSDAKTLAPNASPQQKKDFAASGKKAESASQLELARQRLAEKKATQAANMAAVKK